MNPRQFVELVCEYFRNKGYEAKTNSYIGDYGVDVFATKGKEKVAVQVKMYGGGTRKINRQMVMELHGAKDFFDCTKGVIATDGALLTDAQEVASKLKIEVLYIESSFLPTTKKTSTQDNTFEHLGKIYHSITRQNLDKRQRRNKRNSEGKLE
jgi:restriction system protein